MAIGDLALYCRFEVGQGSQDLLARAEVGQNSAELLAKLIVVHASTLVTATTAILTDKTFQRQTFYAKGLHWAFYNETGKIEYKTSSDGYNWSAPGDVFIHHQSEGFSLFWDGTYVHWVGAEWIYNTGVFYRRGVPNADGSITWSTPFRETARAADAARRYNLTVITVDSNGYPWIGWREQNAGGFFCYVMKSDNNDGTWSGLETPYLLDVASSTLWRAHLVPLHGGRIYVILNQGSNINTKGQLWDGAWQGWEDMGFETKGAGYLSAVSKAGDIYLAFTKDNQDLTFIRRTWGVGWGAEVEIYDPFLSSPPVALSKAAVDGHLYVFWGPNSNVPIKHHVFYCKSENYGQTWSAPVDIIDESENEFTGIDSLNVAYEQGGDVIGFEYTRDYGADWQARYSFINGLTQVGSQDLLVRAEVGQGWEPLFGRAEIRHEGVPVELLAKFEIQDSEDLLANAEIRQSASAEFLAKLVVRHDASAELSAKCIIRHDGTPVELLAKFRAACPRYQGQNWQRKMWYDGTYYWRGRYNPGDDELQFEYIAVADLPNNTWTLNANASINCATFAAGWMLADFTVRGAQNGIPTTIHYSDGVDTWVAESDGASAIGWAWQNLFKVFDGTAPNTYQQVGLAGDRKTPNPKLWVCAVFYDDATGKLWVKARQQTTSLVITGWQVAADVSNVNNFNTFYGVSVRSMGTAGATKDDVIFVYKEGAAIRSRYHTGAAWQAIQDVDTITYPGAYLWDLEHGEDLGMEMAHVVYTDADTSIKWKERGAGAAVPWSAASIVDAATTGCSCEAITEHGSGWLYVLWNDAGVFQYRLHRCTPDIWYPPLASAPLTFDPSIDGIITTSNPAQINMADSVPAGEPLPITWIGETAPVTPCAVGWGILILRANEALLSKAKIRHVGTPVELLGTFVVRHDGIPVELLAKGVIRHDGTPAELLGKGVIRHSDSVNLSGRFWVRWPTRLWTNRRYLNGVIQLTEKLIGDARLEYVIEGVMEDIQGYLENNDLPYDEWTDITLLPVQILRATTYGVVAALYARHTQTFEAEIIPSITPVTITVIGDAEKAMNFWTERMEEMLTYYVSFMSGAILATSTEDEEPIFSMEDIPEDVTTYTPWREWLSRRGSR